MPESDPYRLTDEQIERYATHHGHPDVGAMAKEIRDSRAATREFLEKCDRMITEIQAMKNLLDKISAN